MKTLRFSFYIIAIAIGVVFLALKGKEDNGGLVLEHEEGKIVLLSNTYQLDRYFQSMEGPTSFQSGLRLDTKDTESEVIYLTGVKSEVVNADQPDQVISPEFFCHSNLTFANGVLTPDDHNASFGGKTHMDWRLFTLIPGKMDVNLPEGFGIPVKKDTRFDYLTMTLNQNHGTPPVDVKIRSQVLWKPESPEIRSVFRRSVYVYQQHTEDEKTSPEAPEETKIQESIKPAPESDSILNLSAKAAGAHVGEKCALSCKTDQKGATPSKFTAVDSKHPGATCCVSNASSGGIVSQFGEQNTVHWMVPPGKHSYRSDVTKQMNLPFDTTAHFVTGHVHPYATSLRLLNLETGEVVFEILSEDFPDRIGVASMSELTFMEGYPIQKDGKYELIVDYDNPTTKPIDAMAILYLYLAEEPDTSKLAVK